MAPSSIPVSSVLICLIVLCAGNTAAEDVPCLVYESRTAREVVSPLMKGANETIIDVLYLELGNCKLEAPLKNFPSDAHDVILTKVTFGEQISWEDVLPMNITRKLQISDSVFEDEDVLRRLSIKNIAELSIVNSGLTFLPMFTVSDDCGTKKANFSGNAIRIVSAEAFKALYSSCNQLEDLDLSRNLIRKFPEFRAQNVYKCKLHLDNNPLSCTENDHLTLNQRARDMLIRTPHCEKDGKLVQFWFHDSPICAVCHCYIHSDIYVNCSERGLTRLPAGLPRETTHLDVSGNQLTSLRVPEASPWREYHTVKHLNASRNPITRIDNYAPTLCNLMMLDVSYASLESLPESLVDSLLNSTGCVPLLSVGRLLLGNNPWKCNCDLLPLKLFIGMRAREIMDFFEIKCGLDGKEVYRVREETLCPPPFYVLNPWDVAIAVMSILIILIIYKTIRDYRLQKKTGKLPKFFQFRFHSIGPPVKEPIRLVGRMAWPISEPIKWIALYIHQRFFEDPKTRSASR